MIGLHGIRHRVHLRPIGVVVLLMTLAVLGAPDQASTQSPPRTPLRVGWVLDGAIYLPLYFAAERYFAEEGLEVQTIRFSSGAMASTALAAGSVDVTVTGPDAIVTAIDAGHEIRMFYAPRIALGFTWFARPGLAGWAGLRGGTIAISSFGSVTDSLTRFVLRRRGLKVGVDVKVIQMRESGVRLAALRAGRVDCATLTTPSSHVAERLGLPVLGTQATEVGPPWPQAIFTAQKRFLDGQPGTLRALLRAYVRGVRRARADREGAVELLMSRLKSQRADTEADWAELLPTLDDGGAPPAREMSLFWQVMTATGETAEAWPEPRFFDRRFVDTFNEWAPK